ncbi:MAG: hypothetical protein ACRDHP_18470 [Ktedonobacterales bacterium]
MDSVRILIAGLAAACLLVACLIVVVLRRPRPVRPPQARVEDAEAETLARIYAVHPVPSRPSLEDHPQATRPFAGDATPFGRILEMPATPTIAPNPSFGAWPANQPGFLPALRGGSDGNMGRMPGFSVAEHPPHAAQIRPAEYPEPRRPGALTRVYAEGIRVEYDSIASAVEVGFDACPLRTPDEVTLAFRVLLAKVRTVLKPLQRDRAALLLNMERVEIAPDVAPAWNGAVKQFLLEVCEQVGPGYILVARYDGRTRQPGAPTSAAERIARLPAAAARGLQANMLGSREEAVALLARLRELVAIPG